MANTEEAKVLPSSVEDKPEEFNIQWADSYKPPKDPDTLSHWNAIIQKFIQKTSDQEHDNIDPKIAERLIQASNIYIRLNEFWKEVTNDLPELIKVNGDTEKSREIFDDWVERYKSYFKESTQTPLYHQAEEIFLSWGNILQMNQSAIGPMLSPWLEAMPQWNEQYEKLAKGDLTSLDEGLRLWQEVYGTTLGRYLKMPALGFTKQHSEAMSKAYAELIQFTSSLPFFYQYLYNTEIAALEEVFEEIQKMDIQEQKPETIREIYKIWLAKSEKAFHQLFQRQDFCNTMGEVVKYLFGFKKQLNEVTAQWCTAMSIPSVRDQDKMAMAIQDLRRKVHTQQKAIVALQKSLNEINSRRSYDATAV